MRRFCPLTLALDDCLQSEQIQPNDAIRIQIVGTRVNVDKIVVSGSLRGDYLGLM